MSSGTAQQTREGRGQGWRTFKRTLQYSITATVAAELKLEGRSKEGEEGGTVIFKWYLNRSRIFNAFYEVHMELSETVQ